MTRTTFAPLAGFLFLIYIAIAITASITFDNATSGEGISARLASVGEQASLMQLSLVSSLVTIVVALVLAGALFAITRDVHSDLALMAFSFRVGEGVLAAIGIIAMLGLLWIATATGASAPDAAAAEAIGAVLIKVRRWGEVISAFAFAVGSTLHAYLFLRGRIVPVSLAWLGLFASVLLIVTLPMQLVGFIAGSVDLLLWLPMLVFEVILALWLITRGAAIPVAQ